MSSNNSIDWNKPKPKNQQTAKKGGVKSSANVKSVVAWLAGVVVLVALCVCVFSGGDKPKDEPANENEQTNNAPPAKTNAAPVAPVKPIDPREDYDHEKLYRDERGILRYKTGCRAYDPTRPVRNTVRNLSRPSIFSNECDRAIVSLICRRRGSRLGVRKNYYDPELQAAYMESITTPIRINPNDSERDKRMKQAVIDARKEIAQRIGAGESLGDILTAAACEVRRLADYRSNIEKQIGDMIEKGDLETADVQDVVKAANLMFEKEGLAPLKEDSFVKWNLRLTSETRGFDPDAAIQEYEASKSSESTKE